MVTELEALRSRGWSYAAGWSVAYQGYLARAWKQREKPLRLKGGAVLLLHTVSSLSIQSLDEAGRQCAMLADARDNGDEKLSEAEARNILSQRLPGAL